MTEILNSEKIEFESQLQEISNQELNNSQITINTDTFQENNSSIVQNDASIEQNIDSSNSLNPSSIENNDANKKETLFEYGLEYLENEQKDKIFELLEEIKNIPGFIQQDQSLPDWISIGTIYRYLVAHKWNIENAISGIKNTFEWRSSSNIDTINADTDFIASIRKYKGSYCIGRGKENELICYICPVYNPHSFEEKRTYSIWMMEEALKSLQEPKQKKMIWLLDFSSLQGTDEENKQKSKDRRKNSRESMKMVMDHYPETLKKMYFINPPFFFRLLWKFLSLFIDKNTYEKIKIITGDQVSQELLQFIPEDQLDTKYGGKMNLTDSMKENWHLLLRGETIDEQLD